MPVILIPQVPDAPVPVGDGTSVPMAKPTLVLAAEAEVALVPPLAIGNVPVMSAVLRLTASQLEFVPSVWRYLLALLVWTGSSALSAALAVVCPVPPLAMANVPVMLLVLISLKLVASDQTSTLSPLAIVMPVPAAVVLPITVEL